MNFRSGCRLFNHFLHSVDDNFVVTYSFYCCYCDECRCDDMQCLNFFFEMWIVCLWFLLEFFLSSSRFHFVLVLNVYCHSRQILNLLSISCLVWWICAIRSFVNGVSSHLKTMHSCVCWFQSNFKHRKSQPHSILIVFFLYIFCFWFNNQAYCNRQTKILLWNLHKSLNCYAWTRKKKETTTWKFINLLLWAAKKNLNSYLSIVWRQ